MTGKPEEGKKGKEVKRKKKERERQEEKGRRKQRNKDTCDYFELDTVVGPSLHLR